MIVLALESSCDETAAAVTDGRVVLAEAVRSQVDLHRLYGGVVPEIASRAHLEAVDALASEVLRGAGVTLGRLGGIAVTQGPGLMGALLVAMGFAKGLALASGLPATGVNHVKAHALAPFLVEAALYARPGAGVTAGGTEPEGGAGTEREAGAGTEREAWAGTEPEGGAGAAAGTAPEAGAVSGGRSGTAGGDGPEARAASAGGASSGASSGARSRPGALRPPRFPLAALVASGGHTSLFLMEDFLTFRTLGRTLDDAAGEAFDKSAKLMGLGYPGGAVIERMAERGDPSAYRISRPMMKGGFDFSFSGLKTRVADLYRAHGMDGLPDGAKELCDLAASFQAAAVDVMSAKLASAVSSTGAEGAVLAGGVAANGALRRAASEACAGLGVPLYVPKPSWCADNAAMIGFLGSLQLERGINPLALSAEAKTRWNVECPA